MADIYGVKNAEGTWFVKLYMENEQVVIMSCHPPCDPIPCADGTVVQRRRKS